jgi:hypothetical protein
VHQLTKESTRSNEPVTYGFTRKQDRVHAFRKNPKTHADQCIHRTGPRDAHGYLFIPKPDLDPSHPMTCPDCLKQLENERKIDELARATKKKAAKV